MRKKDIITLGLYLLALAVTTSAMYRVIKGEWVDYARAQDQFQKKAYDAAINSYQKAIQGGIMPRDLVHNLALCYQETDQKHEAANLFRTFIDRSEDPAVLYQVATKFESQSHLNLASDAYRAILRSRPWEKNVRIRLARILAWTNQSDLAVRQYRIALGEEKP